MLIPLLYSFIKRIKFLRNWIKPIMPMRTMLAWHIYAGVIGPIFVLLHTGHKFESTLGIAVTAMTLIVVFSGFIGRYLLSSIGQEMKEKNAQLKELKQHYEATLAEVRNSSEVASLVKPFAGFIRRIFGSFLINESVPLAAEHGVGYRAVRLSESIADLEYAIASHETLKSAFKKWLKLHITISMILYLLMALHVWASVHFGIRWFS